VVSLPLCHTFYDDFYDDVVRAIGWIVTYVIQVRHGGPSSGYISSGFFGGKSTLMTS